MFLSYFLVQSWTILSVDRWVKCWNIYEPMHDKANKMIVCPAKTQISLGIHPVWSESSLCAQWVAKDPRFLIADSEDSDQTGQMPRLVWVLAGYTGHFVGFVVCRLIHVYNTNVIFFIIVPIWVRSGRGAVAGMLALHSKDHWFHPPLLQSFEWDFKSRSSHDLVVSGMLNSKHYHHQQHGCITPPEL